MCGRDSFFQSRHMCVSVFFPELFGFWKAVLNKLNGLLVIGDEEAEFLWQQMHKLL